MKAAIMHSQEMSETLLQTVAKFDRCSSDLLRATSTLRETDASLTAVKAALNNATAQLEHEKVRSAQENHKAAAIVHKFKDRIASLEWNLEKSRKDLEISNKSNRSFAELETEVEELKEALKRTRNELGNNQAKRAREEPEMPSRKRAEFNNDQENVFPFSVSSVNRQRFSTLKNSVFGPGTVDLMTSPLPRLHDIFPRMQTPVQKPKKQTRVDEFIVKA